MAKRKRFGHNDFQLKDKKLTQTLKTKKLDIPGTIIELIKSQDINNRSFAIKTIAKEVLLRSGRYIRLDLTQPTNQQQNDKNIVQTIKIVQSW